MHRCYTFIIYSVLWEVRGFRERENLIKDSQTSRPSSLDIVQWRKFVLGQAVWCNPCGQHTCFGFRLCDKRCHTCSHVFVIAGRDDIFGIGVLYLAEVDKAVGSLDDEVYLCLRLFVVAPRIELHGDAVKLLILNELYSAKIVKFFPIGPQNCEKK